MRGLERIAADRRHLIAAQVRCSTGFTWGLVKAQGEAPAVPKLRPGPPPGPSMAAVKAEAATRAAKLLALLEAWPESEPLELATALARRLGLPEGGRNNHAVDAVARAFLVLEAQGALRSIAGSREQCRGERMVRLRSGRVLRTPGAPPFWAQLLAGDAA